VNDSPPLPKSRRNLSDLDSLIADSIGKMGSYGEMRGSPKTDQDSTKSPSSGPQSQTIPPSEPMSGDDKPERFQIALSGAVIIAAKLEALKQKTTAGEITERALRSYLGLPPKA
jgi:hypothetical protein